MKISKLFVLSALWLLGLNANAADLIERTAPSVTEVAAEPVEFKADHQYLLYNTGAQMFFSQGNAWGTRASGNANQEQALRLYFTKYVPAGGEWDGVTYIFKIWSSVRNTTYSWHECFFDGRTAMYVDRGSQANLYWEIQDMGNKVYRLKAAQANPDHKSNGTEYVGRDASVAQDDANLSDVYDNANAYPLSPMLTEGEGISVDWVFYDAEAVFGAYEASQELKTLIISAEETGTDVSAAVAVYNNESATLEQINAAIEALKNAMGSSYADGTGRNPKDASFLLVNSTFDTIGDFHGWSGSGFGAGGTKSTNAEWYEQGQGADTYQDVADLIPGYYVAGAKGFYRAGSTSDSYGHFKAQDESTKSVQLYAKANGQTYETNVCSNFQDAPTTNPTVDGQVSEKDSETGITYYVPNTMASAEVYMHKLGLYDNFVFVQVGEDKALRIGVKKSGTKLTSDWAIFDDFTLTYVGTNPNDCYPGLAWKLLQAYPDYEGELVTADVLAAYMNFKNNDDQRMTISDQAGLDSFIAQLKAQKALVDENAALWKQWEALVNEGQTLKGEGNDELDEYVEYDAPEIKEACTLTNEELNADIAKLEEWIEQAQMKVTPGTDVTNMYLKNADCEKTDGWEGGPVTGTGGGNTCFEKYGQSNFDVYQVVKKAPKGVYSIEVQGFYRRMRPESGSYDLYKNGEQTPCGYVYMNNNATPLKCVYDDPNEDKYSQGNDEKENPDGVMLYYPNDMTSAAEAFAAGKYKSKAYGLVLSAGDELRIGVKGQEGGSDWAIWDNFKLVYEGYTADVVKPVLEEQIAAAKTKANEKMGKDVKEALNAAIAEAEAAAAGTDGEAMFNALVKISDINPDASIEKFKNLNKRNEELAEAVTEAECAPSTIQEAQTLNQQITSGIEAGTYTDADVEDLLAQITSMIKKLGIPEDMENATDDNPVPATTIITNPDYDKGNNEGWTLDAKPGFNKGLIEVYDANFDEYQDLENLPAGTYEVSVQGFYRYGDGVRDDSTYVQAPTENNNLLLYVTVGENSIHVPMPRLAQDGKQEYTSFTKSDDGKSFIAGDDIETASDRWQWMWLGTPVADADSTSATGYRLANGMVPVSILFEEGKFGGTSIIFTVGAEGKARIGLKKIVQEKNNWCIWDNWQLTYYGANSTKTPTVDGIVSASAAAAAKVEFFGLNGARISKPTKGVAIMRQTMSDGTVKTSKVIIK